MANARNYSNTSVNTTLNGAITNVGTSVVLTSQTGMPTPPFVLSIEPDTVNEELVLVTSGAGTGGSPYVVTRAYDGTAGIAHSSLVTVQHRVSAVDFTDSRTHEASSTGVHGLNGSGMSVNGGTPGLTSNISYNTSIAETTVSKSFQIPGGSLVAGSLYRVSLFGTLACTGTPNIIWKFKYGSTVLAQVTTTFLSGLSGDFYADGVLNIQSAGGSGSMSGVLRVHAPAINTAVASSMPTDTQGLLTSISTTSNQNLLVTATWSASSGSNALVTMGSSIEQLF